MEDIVFSMCFVGATAITIITIRGPTPMGSPWAASSLVALLAYYWYSHTLRWALCCVVTLG